MTTVSKRVHPAALVPKWWARAVALAPVAALLAACSPEVTSHDEPAGPPWRADSTSSMVARLEQLQTSRQRSPHAFMSMERVRIAERNLTTARPTQRSARSLALGRERLHAGLTEEAISIFEELRNQATTAAGPLSEYELTRWLATAYLRLGEQQNCLEHHSTEACLFPIQEAGVHHQQNGSRTAMTQLTRLLELEPDDLESRWLLNIAAMTVGEYPDGVPEAARIPAEVLESDVPIGRLSDVAPHLGVDAMGLAGGSVLEDFDNDGRLDLMVSSWGGTDQLQLFINSGNGRFEERTVEAGLLGLTGGLNLVHADYDNDGLADVLVLRGAWLFRAGGQPNSLLRNLGPDENGHVRFEDVTEASGILDFHPTQAAAWGDFDNDGWLDLFVGNESVPGFPNPCKLFRSNGAPADEGPVTFSEVAASVGVAAGGMVKGVAWGDVDNDGWIDLYLSRFGAPNLLFHNRPAEDGREFSQIAQSAGVAEPRMSFPTWFWDVDNDGWLDLFVGSYPGTFTEAGAGAVAAEALGLPHTAERSRLFRNVGASGAVAFETRPDDRRLASVMFVMGSNYGDVDNDGYPDAYLGNGAPSLRALMPNRLLRNDSGEGFQDVTTSAGVGHLQKGHAVSFGDIDNDGDQDIYAVMGGAYSGDVYQNVLFENPGQGNRSITLRLEGTRANRSAIGARLRLVVAENGARREIHAVVGTGGSFGSNPLRQEIGVGRAETVETLEVRWPGTESQTFRGLPTNAAFLLREGDADPHPLELERFDLSP